MLACLHPGSTLGQQPAPPGVDRATFAAKRFPQPVRVGDLLRRSVLAPSESRPLLGHVARVIQLGDGSQAIVVAYGGLWGLGSRNIAVPLDAMVLLGAELEILDFTPEQLDSFPTYAGAGRTLGTDDIIHMGLAHPSH
jgi:hypothetical protein